tara:strand:- start:20735 stop:20842 length:108 start_codon:yes stop_codon:yes gene_type:complete
MSKEVYEAVIQAEQKGELWGIKVPFIYKFDRRLLF